jgi:hypothetical protein
VGPVARSGSVSIRFFSGGESGGKGRDARASALRSCYRPFVLRRGGLRQLLAAF